MKRLPLVLFVIGSCGVAEEQPSHYVFPWGACMMDVSYDPGLEDAESVKNTTDFLTGSDNFTNGLVGDALLSACHAYAAHLRTTRFVNLSSVKTAAENTADTMDAVCEIHQLELRASKDPDVLRSYPNGGACIIAVDALEGKTDIVEYWRRMIAEQAKESGNPDDFLAKQLAHEKAPDFYDWINSQVLKSGWRKCVIRNLQPSPDTVDRQTREAEKDFEEKFPHSLKNCPTHAG